MRTTSTPTGQSPVLIGILALAALPTSGAVIQCRDADGGRYFSQFQCPPRTTLVEPAPHPPGTLSIISTEPLSENERQALAALEKSLANERRQRSRDRERSARARAARAAEDRADCAEALARLDGLAATRRKGYSAADERRLEAEEDHWQTIRRSTC